MEKQLNDAAIEGDVSTLRQLLGKDPNIFDKASLNCKINPLHIAAFLGHVDFVKAIVNTNSDMCLARDRDGRNPLHLAAIKGRLEVLQVLINARPLAARERTDGGGTIFHLCVKYNQLEALKMLVEALQDPQLLNSEDDEGMTILHLAILDKQIETIKYLVEKKIDAGAKNRNGQSALDLVQRGDMNSNMEVISLRKAAAAGSGGALTNHQALRWAEKRGEGLMVVASLIATMTFQAVISPAGGVWQDDLDSSATNINGNPVIIPHKAGEAQQHFFQLSG